jgi:hypothetical protein
MADVRKEENLGITEGGPADGSNPSHPSPSTEARKPYRAPKLRLLGSVKELTAGAQSGANDGSGFTPAG